MHKKREIEIVKPVQCLNHKQFAQLDCIKVRTKALGWIPQTLAYKTQNHQQRKMYFLFVYRTVGVSPILSCHKSNFTFFLF